jgi:hypothetical protein
MPQTHIRKAQNRKRPTAPLPEGLNTRLGDYTQAAKGASRAESTWLLSGVTVSAVGIGMLALPQLGNAEVVYTPANQSVSEFGQRRLAIDFNHDGVVDASLSLQGYCLSGSGFRQCFGSIFAVGLNGNGAMSSGGGFASAARAGKIIGQQDKFQDVPRMEDCRSGGDAITHTYFRTFKGPWANVQHRYLGFKFTIDGETHYGWARLTTRGCPSIPAAQLTGYAYETVANRPIVAGVESGSAEAELVPLNNGDAGAQSGADFGSLGMLAVGASGLEIWRKLSETEVR